MREDAKQQADRRLQMPPAMDARKPINQILEVDEAIKGYDKVKLAVVDISHPVHDRDRVIVVREPDGTLREAEWEERDRLNQLFFPRQGRKTAPRKTPEMFEPENLKEILRSDRYEYILDRNCVQFEPDHPTFIATAEAVYEDVLLKQDFEALDSTRHFGPMVFYLVWNRKCDSLIAHYLKALDLKKAADVARLFGKVHEKAFDEAKDDLECIKSYISEESTSLSLKLEEALKAIENAKEAQNVAFAAHGVKPSE